MTILTNLRRKDVELTEIGIAAMKVINPFSILN